MGHRVKVGGVAALCLLAAVGTASAAPGFVVDGVNLRAGPGVDYPLLAPLAAGTPAEIYGCLDGFTWCDVAVDGPDGALRGWAAGPRLQLALEGAPVLLPEYGPRLGLPVVGFDLDGYWGRHYRDRPFYADEGRWRGDDRGGSSPGPGFDRGGAAGEGHPDGGGFRPDVGDRGGYAGGARPEGEPGRSRAAGEDAHDLRPNIGSQGGYAGGTPPARFHPDIGGQGGYSGGARPGGGPGGAPRPTDEPGGAPHGSAPPPGRPARPNGPG